MRIQTQIPICYNKEIANVDLIALQNGKFLLWNDSQEKKDAHPNWRYVMYKLNSVCQKCPGYDNKCPSYITNGELK
ncbi:MAG: hypothetical protein WC438_04220 [Candidatus Pacearchaeota archaeon]